MVMSENLTKKRLLSVACHASIFLSATLVSVGIPLAIYFISDDGTVKENAKEALNFHEKYMGAWKPRLFRAERKSDTSGFIRLDIYRILA
jgi:hypothetical protein